MIAEGLAGYCKGAPLIPAPACAPSTTVCVPSGSSGPLDGLTVLPAERQMFLPPEPW